MANVCLCMERFFMLQPWADMDGDGFGERAGWALDAPAQDVL